MRVSEDTAHSFYQGARLAASVGGRHRSDRPRADGHKQGKYSWAKSPRYNVAGQGYIPLEVGPLARRDGRAGPGAAAHQDDDPLFLDISTRSGRR